MTAVPELFWSLCDDAALFPPGNAPLREAVPAHFAHRAADYGKLVGPFVFPAPRIGELATALPEAGPPLELSLTAPDGPSTLPAAIADLDDRATLRAVEVPLPQDTSITDFFGALVDVPVAAGVDAYVEVPRDARRTAVLDAISATGMRAKFRTGGVRADLYPDERELAESIRLAVDRAIPFKATAGLHHAIRNTDPVTGFEQHGFLNLLLAAATAEAGASVDTIADVLALRDGAAVATRVQDLDPVVRTTFVSYGTCSVLEPMIDLVDLNLVDRRLLPEQIHPEGVTA